MIEGRYVAIDFREICGNLNCRFIATGFEPDGITDLVLPPGSRNVWPGHILSFWTRPPREVEERSRRLQPATWLSGHPCHTRLSSTIIWQCLHDHGMNKERIEGIICFNWVYTTNHYLLTRKIPTNKIEPEARVESVDLPHIRQCQW